MIKIALNFVLLHHGLENENYKSAFMHPYLSSAFQWHVPQFP